MAIMELAGQVRTLDDKPLEGVTVRIDNLATKTDATGRFVLSSAPLGHHELGNGYNSRYPGSKKRDVFYPYASIRIFIL